MKINYEIPIIYNDLFKNESLFQAISNLEKLEQISVDVFNRINKSLIDKKTKLENLKSRINRANCIISSFENLPQAITLKSKRFYPTNGLNNSNNDKSNSNVEYSPDANYRLSNVYTNQSNSTFNHQSIYFEDVCDFSLIKIPSIKSHQDINTKPSNPSSKLGKKPDGMLDDVSLYQDILNSVQPYKEMTSEFKFSSQAPIFKSSDKQEIPSGIDKMNSIFQFMEKTRIYGVKKTSHIEPRESKILNKFMKKKTKNANIKKPQDAPVSITEKVKLTKYKQKKDVIRRNTNATIQLNIPKNINLPLISDFDIETTPIEDYFAEDNENEVYAPQEAIFNDDINEFQTPLDIIKNYNKKQSQLFTIENFAGLNTGNTNNTNNIGNNNNNRHETETNSNNNVNPNKENTQNNMNTTTNSNIQATNNYANLNTNNNSNNIANHTQNSDTNQTTVQKQPNNIPSVPFNNQPIPQAPITTAKPNVPTIPNNSNSSKIPAAPKIPLPPPIPKVPAVPLNNIPKPDIKPIPKPTPAVEARSFLDEIASDNPMARLKKIGTINVNSSKEEKKEEKKPPNQASMVRNILI